LSLLIVNSAVSSLISPNVANLVSSPGQLLAIDERRKSGLILCKEHHAEFVGPGSAIAVQNEQNYKAIIAIGSPELLAVNSSSDRAKAYGLRIQWSRWLHRIADHPDPLTRVERLFAGLEGFFSRQVVMSLPVEVLASLVGVFPQTVVRVRENFFAQANNTAYLFPPESLKVTVIMVENSNPKLVEMPLSRGATMKEIQHTYALLRSA
jgi:hypothetical protein